MDQWNIQEPLKNDIKSRDLILDRFALRNKARKNILLHSYKWQTSRDLDRQMVPNYALSVPTELYRGIVRVKILPGLTSESRTEISSTLRASR